MLFNGELIEQDDFFIEGVGALSPARIYGPADDFYLDLQFFAAEDEGRTEDPSETKKRKAREEGKVPKSQEISSVLVLLFTFWGISLFGHFILDGFKDTFRFFYGNINQIQISMGNINSQISKVGALFLQIMAPILGIAIFVAVLSNVVQVGFLFTWKPLKPDFTKVAFTPKKLFQKVLFSKQSLMNLFKSVVKIGGVGAISYLIIRGEIAKFLNLVNIGVLQGLNDVTSVAFKLINGACLALIALAIPDYIFQRRQHLESLKMSIPEMKEERKQEEGDPFVKQRIMQKSRELAQRNLPANVKSADVVVTNPTHIAVAMKFEEGMHAAPVVVAKGGDHLCHVIKQIAAESGVAVMENKPLAWALYNDVEIGDAIPEELYEAVVLIYTKLAKYNQEPATV